MSIKAMSWAQDQITGSPATKLVLFKLADNANDTGVCWPSIDTIARHTELSKSSVKTHIKKLVELDLLTVEHRKQETTNLSNVYHLNIHNINFGQGRAGRGLPIGQGLTVGGASTDSGMGQDVTPNSKKQQSMNSKESMIPEETPKSVSIWNRFATKYKLSTVTKLTPKRARLLKQRESEPTFDMTAICLAAIKQDFLLGKNDRGWALNFDFVIRSEDNYTKILECGYGNGHTPKLIQEDEISPAYMRGRQE